FRDTDGSFRMDGFAPGAWKLHARSKGHGESEPVSVTLPGAGPVVLVVPREARVIGRVLDPGGAPVAGARIELVEERGLGSFRTAERDKTEEQGAFALDGIDPGTIVLQASAS